MLVSIPSAGVIVNRTTARPDNRIRRSGRAVVRPSLVNFHPLAVASEPRLPLIHLSIELDTGLPVVNLLAAEALIARHEGRTGQLAASTVVRAGVIVVGHVFPFVLRLYVPHYSLLSAYVYPKR